MGIQTTGIPAHLLLVNNVAKRLGLSCRTVRYLAQTGAIRAHKAGTKIWKFLATDVDEYRVRREAHYD